MQDRQGEVRWQLEQTGPRPPVPPEDLAATTAAAHTAWRGELERPAGRAETAEHAATMEPRAHAADGRTALAQYQEYTVTAPGRRQLSDWALTALIAAMLVLAIGLVW